MHIDIWIQISRYILCVALTGIDSFWSQVRLFIALSCHGSIFSVSHIFNENKYAYTHTYRQCKDNDKIFCQFICSTQTQL